MVPIRMERGDDTFEADLDWFALCGRLELAEVGSETRGFSLAVEGKRAQMWGEETTGDWYRNLATTQRQTALDNSGNSPDGPGVWR